MTDEELAERLKRLAPTVRPRASLLEEAADRILALSAHNALLKASLAREEREADAVRNTEPFGYFHATPFGWEACGPNDECALALYERPEPDRVAELTAEVERLRWLLSEAAEDILNWGSYASEYFQEKHDLAGCVGKYRAAALAGKEAQS